MPGAPFLRGETIGVLRSAVTVDRYGNETRTDYTQVAQLYGCAVYPATSVDLGATNRDGTTTSLTVLVPPDSDVLPTDRLVIRGRTYAIDGEPHDWHSPLTGWEPGMQVTVYRVEG